jgi:hypothetical protein
VKFTYHYECGSRRVDAELDISTTELFDLCGHDTVQRHSNAMFNDFMEAVRSELGQGSK